MDSSTIEPGTKVGRLCSALSLLSCVLVHIQEITDPFGYLSGTAGSSIVALNIDPLLMTMKAQRFKQFERI